MSFVCGSKTGGLGGSLIERAEPPADLSEGGSVLSVSGGAGMTLTLTGEEEGKAGLVLTKSFGGGWIARSGLGMGARRGGGKTSGDSVLVDFTPAGKRGKEWEMISSRTCSTANASWRSTESSTLAALEDEVVGRSASARTVMTTASSSRVRTGSECR